MASITAWTRLEPSTDRDDLQDSLAGRLNDPLWQLTRQWQIGEFTAEDTGSPVSTRVRVEQAPLTRYRAGLEGPSSRYDPRVAPLEATVEDEPAEPDLRLSAIAGVHFLRLLSQAGVGRYGAAYSRRYTLDWPAADPRLDDASRRFLTVMGGKTPDGISLYADLRATNPVTLPAEPEIPEHDQAAVLTAAQTFLTWCHKEIGEPTPSTAWQTERMEYEFAVAAPSPTGETVLTAQEYTDGHLDWSTFDHAPGTTLGADGDRDELQTVTRTVIPTPVTYRGMPAARWWEFEDAAVDFGQVSAGPTDLLRLLLVSFAVEYGNDWYVLPVELDVGAVYRVRSLVVTDSFGQRTLVPPAAQVDTPRRDWRMYTPTPDVTPPAGAADDSAEMFLLAPAIPAGLQGEPIEEVLLLRDEMANMAWAVERTVPSAAGGRLDRSVNGSRATPRGEMADGLQYRLATTVPDNWLPLVPQRINETGPDIRLRRGQVLLDRGGRPTTPTALGRILDATAPLAIHEEEVPRAGARVTRAYQYTRWSDGSSHLWLGRRKTPGRGEGWSGLRFDVVEPLP